MLKQGIMRSGNLGVRQERRKSGTAWPAPSLAKPDGWGHDDEAGGLARPNGIPSAYLGVLCGSIVFVCDGWKTGALNRRGHRGAQRRTGGAAQR